MYEPVTIAFFSMWNVWGGSSGCHSLVHFIPDSICTFDVQISALSALQKQLCRGVCVCLKQAGLG